jgi:hypothetical protein
MSDYLNTIELAKSNPFVTTLSKFDIESLTQILSKLKAFVRFLSKLSAADYLQWMIKAFSGKAPTEKVSEFKQEVIRAETPTQHEIDMAFTAELSTVKPTKSKRLRA